MCFLREASKYLLEVLESVREADLNDVIERILDAVEKQPRKWAHFLCLQKYQHLLSVYTLSLHAVSSSMIELSVVEIAVQDCSQSCDETM